jgi:peptide/nickel transport system permease protein
VAEFIVRRLIQSVVVLLLVSVFAFSLLHIIPGDPVLNILGEHITQEQIDTLRHELGLDQPVVRQYINWVRGVTQGDFGRSIIYNESVRVMIATRLPITLHLGLISFMLSALVGIPVGIISAIRRGEFLDSVVSVLAYIGMAAPVFWLGILGIYTFALKLQWLPVQGYTSPFEDFWLNTRQIIMPAILLAVIPIATLARQTRSAMLEVLQQNYITTARSKGLPERAVIMGHALKNAIIPVVTLLGVQTRSLIGGSVLVETVFNIPGMGRLLVNGVFSKDIVIVQAIIIMVGITVALSNLIVDISYGYLDPRVRVGK